MTWPEILKKNSKELEALKETIYVLISAVESKLSGSIDIHFSQGGVTDKVLHKKVK